MQDNYAIAAVHGTRDVRLKCRAHVITTCEGPIMGKVVQTEVDASEYSILEGIVRKRRMTIK